MSPLSGPTTILATSLNTDDDAQGGITTNQWRDDFATRRIFTLEKLHSGALSVAKEGAVPSIPLQISSPVSIQTQSLALRVLRKRKPQEISRNKRKRQPIGMLGRSSGNHDWLLANASACVSYGFHLRSARNARNASGCVWMETGLHSAAVDDDDADLDYDNKGNNNIIMEVMITLQLQLWL